MNKSNLLMKQQLIQRIEESLDWGKGSTWSNKDFEELSERILITTNKRISVTTLKRIWGRTEWVANPSVATLDILSQYIGFENWRDFERKNKLNLPKQKRLKKSTQPIIWIPIIALVIIGSYFGFHWKTKTNESESVKEVPANYKPDDFTFTNKPVSVGLPNSVVFEYDASAANDVARIEIQQDWDERKRVLVDKKDSISTSIYYRPGFFKSKLVVDSSIVQEKDVFIPTHGWLGVIESDSIPTYLSEKDFKKNHSLQISPETLIKYGVDPSIKQTYSGFYQVKDFGKLFTDDFEMSTLIRNEFKSGVSVCQRVQVMVMHEDGPIKVALSDKGCISDISLYAFGQVISGKKTNLSDFGVDFTEYIELKYISKNQKLDVFVNNNSIYTFDLPDSRKKIIGICLLFEGAGSVKKVEFKKKDTIIYQTNF